MGKWFVGQAHVPQFRDASRLAIILSLLFCLPSFTTANSTIKFGIDPNYPPFSYLDSNERYVGFNVDMIEKICQPAEIKVQFEPLEWRHAIEDLKNGFIDALPMSYSPERAINFDFTEPFYIRFHSIFCNSDRTKYTDINQLSGKSVIVRSSSYVDDYLTHNFPQVILIRVTTEIDAIKLLSKSMYDCAILPKITGLAAIKVNGVSNIAITSKPILPANYCLAVPKSDTTFINLLNNGIHEVLESGTYDELYHKWILEYTGHKKSLGEAFKHYLIILAPLSLLGIILLIWSLPLRKKRTQWQLAAIYVIAGSLWIIITDSLASYYITSPESLARIQMIKGWIYVLGSGFIIYAIVRHYVKWVDRNLIEIEVKNAQLNSINRALTTVSQCNLSLIHSKDDNELLTSICHNLVEYGGYYMSWVGKKIEDPDKTIQPLTYAGGDVSILRDRVLSWSESNLAPGPSTMAILTGKSQIIPNAAKDPELTQWFEQTKKYHINSVISYPLLVQDSIFGCLTIYSHEIDSFGPEEILLLNELVTDINYGLTNFAIQKERDTALLEVESLARFPSENPNPVMRISFDGVILYANETAGKLLRPLHTKVGMLAPDQLLGPIQSKKVSELELLWEKRIYSFAIIPIPNMNYANLYGRDVTAKVSAENTLRESEKKFRETLSNMLEGCQTIGFDWKYLYLNETAVTQSKLKRENLICHTMMECYPGIENSQLFYALHECMENRASKVIENEFFYPDGSSAWFLLSIEPVHDGLFLLSIDITDRKIAEQHILHLNSVLKGIRNVNQLIVHEKDRIKLIQQACDLLVEARGFFSVCIGLMDNNKLSAYATSGSEMNSLLKLFKVGQVPPCATAALNSDSIVLRNSTNNYDCESCQTEPDSPHPPRDVLILKIKHDYQTYGFMMVTVPENEGYNIEEHDLLIEVAGDIAFALYSIGLEEQRATLEEQYRQAQKMEAVGCLAGGIAHDFNNLLSVINGYSDYAIQITKPDNPLYDDLLEIRNAGERATLLTKQLLIFSRKQIVKPEVLDLNRVITNLEKMLGRMLGEDIVFNIKLKPDIHRVLADPGQIEQIIMNLAINSRDAMPNGGKLTLETFNAHLDEIYRSSHYSIAPGDYVVLSLTDTGVGMSPEIQAKIFEPFFTTKEAGKGTGLGLATVYGIAQQLNGHVSCYSEVNKGTCFKIYLPPTTDIQIPTKTKTTLAESKGNEILLVVEDDESVRSISVRFLADAGYTVLVASNPEEALAIVQQQLVPINLLLTDVIMPGMSGKVLANRIAEKFPTMKILFMSGYTDTAISQQGIMDKEFHLINKPFSYQELTHKIRSILDNQ